MLRASTFLGKPSKLKNNPDYVPSLFSYSVTGNKSQQRKSRYERFEKRQNLIPAENSGRESNEREDEQFVAITQQHSTDHESVTSGDQGSDEDQFEVHAQHSIDQSTSYGVDQSTSCVPVVMEDKYTMTDSDLELTVKNLRKSNESLTRAINILSNPAASLINNDKLTLFYTGIPSYKMFDSLVKLILPHTKVFICSSPHNQLLMVLMKLRLGLTFQDLAQRFQISLSSVSGIFHEWLNILSRELKQLIVWPDQEILRATLPECFKEKYIRTTCIIDCSEIFIERPSSLSARAETFSNYKHHNTVKFLVAVSPTGAIIFVSKCWGGRVSDRHLTINCGFMDKLTYGDLVLADRGFDISDDLALIGASLAIPPFTRGKAQLSQREINSSRALSRVRIHVERAIGRIKNFKLLQSTIPITLLKKPHEFNYTTIDKILVVCAALSNLHPMLVH